MELKKRCVRTKEQLIGAKDYRKPNIQLEYEDVALNIKDISTGGK
jgi:hypothetical protein